MLGRLGGPSAEPSDRVAYFWTTIGVQCHAVLVMGYPAQDAEFKAYLQSWLEALALTQREWLSALARRKEVAIRVIDDADF